MSEVIPAQAGIQRRFVIPAQAGIQRRFVVPAQAGIQGFGEGRYALLGPRLRGDDVLLMTCS